jgi:hypothetical protein
MAAAGGASGYALTLGEDEVRRYRYMAEAARQSEQDLWQAAGITPGATVPMSAAAQAHCSPPSWTLSGPAAGSSELTGTPGPSQRRSP